MSAPIKEYRRIHGRPHFVRKHNLPLTKTTGIRQLLASRRERLERGELKAGEIAFSTLSKATDIPSNATPNEVAAWTIVSRVLLNLDETLTKG